MHQPRLHALDAIRGFALLLGLVLHGSMSFWPGLEELGYPIVDNSRSMPLTYMFYVLHMFRMAVFFLVAGFFAHLSLHRKGVAGFFKDRFKRIAVPLVVAWILSLILIVPIVLWAASKLYGPDYMTILQCSRAAGPSLPILMHFWFLYYLLWFYAIAVLCSQLLSAVDPREIIAGALTSASFNLCRTRLLLVFAAAISALVFYQRENWLVWAGIPTPTEAVWREAPAFFIYGLAFCIGWLFDRDRECFVFLKRDWQLYLALALLATTLCICLLPPEIFTPVTLPASDKFLYAGAYSLASWAWILTIIGAGMQYFDRESATRRYVADASYWIYLTHLPLLFFLQTLFMDLPLHWSLKFPLILLIATPILFWTYEHWVRYTVIGCTLNGPRQRPQATVSGPTTG